MYIECNINPKKHKVGDCGIRAVGAATGLGWEGAFKELAEVAFSMKRAMDDRKVVAQVLLNHGFKEGKIKVVKGQRRITVEQFANSHPDLMCVLWVAHHYVACCNGNYVDIWDSGDCAVYKYYYKER